MLFFFFFFQGISKDKQDMTVMFPLESMWMVFLKSNQSQYGIDSSLFFGMTYILLTVSEF